MEDVIITGGVLPPAAETEPAAPSADRVITESEKSEKPRRHERSPVLTRNLTIVIMSITAAAGAAAGVLTAFSGNADAGLIEGLSRQLGSSFGDAFLRTAARSVLFLLAELALGFFAFGDTLVWCVPFLYAEGAALRACLGEPQKILPCEVICTAAMIFGAARSAGMSELLLKLSRGGTVYMEDNPTRAFAVNILACFAGTVCGALFAGIGAAV